MEQILNVTISAFLVLNMNLIFSFVVQLFFCSLEVDKKIRAIWKLSAIPVGNDKT